jgi:chloramphenicol 3-O-phosphotransferase
MSELGGQFLALLAAAVLLLAASGFLYDHRRRRRARLPSLLRGDQQRAQATVNYYLHVHDSAD